MWLRIWHDLVHIGEPAGEKVIRTILVYLIVLGLLRVFGKRQLASLNALDLVVLLLLSNVVQNAIIGDDNSLLGGLLGAAILLAVNYVLVRAAFMSPRFGKTLQGGATVLYANGRLNHRALRREAVTREELVAALRRQGLELDEVERVTLEPEGTFNAVPKPRPGIEDVIARLERIEQKLSA